MNTRITAVHDNGAGTAQSHTRTINADVDDATARLIGLGMLFDAGVAPPVGAETVEVKVERERKTLRADLGEVRAAKEAAREAQAKQPREPSAPLAATINMNDMVRGTLTEVGRKVFGRVCSHYEARFPDYRHPLRARRQGDVLEIQLWELAYEFGPHISHGEALFEGNLLELVGSELGQELGRLRVEQTAPAKPTAWQMATRLAGDGRAQFAKSDISAPKLKWRRIDCLFIGRSLVGRSSEWVEGIRSAVMVSPFPVVVAESANSTDFEVYETQAQVIAWADGLRLAASAVGKPISDGQSGPEVGRVVAAEQRGDQLYATIEMTSEPLAGLMEIAKERKGTRRE